MEHFVLWFYPPEEDGDQVPELLLRDWPIYYPRREGVVLINYEIFKAEDFFLISSISTYSAD